MKYKLNPSKIAHAVNSSDMSVIRKDKYINFIERYTFVDDKEFNVYVDESNELNVCLKSGDKEYIFLEGEYKEVKSDQLEFDFETNNFF